ncbi:MAG TPA: aldehyde dehydrogenase family protein [Polyangiaceae bacterium]|nr:aldehyde dehydrogenase family protein [Polyangiaceae bacterium]
MSRVALDRPLYVGSRCIVDGPTATVREPWSGAELGRVVLATAAEVEEAAAASVRAFERLRTSTSFERKTMLLGVAQEVQSLAESFAELIAREAGKPIALARAEVARAVSTFELASEEAGRIGGEVMPLDITAASRGYTGFWVRVPAGPVLGISPFNFPLNLVAHKVAPALACGTSIVLKPPPQAPLTSLLLAECIRRSGVPGDAVQVVPCEVAMAEKLVTDDRFATLSFTGSAAVGWRLKSISGKKRVLLELGGNAAVIVHDDTPLEWAADRIVAGAFGYAGQVCIKVQRLYVHRSIADRFLAKIVERAREVEPSSPLDPTALCGPMIDEANAVRVEQWVAQAAVEGARVACGGRRDGNRYWPTVLEIDGSGRGLKVVDEEVFGPVLTVHVYDTWDEALTLADSTRYGLQAGIFTDSRARIAQAFARLHVGGLVVNDAPTFRVDSMPYGGTRDSGLGREGVRFAIMEMTEPKLLVVREG